MAALWASLLEVFALCSTSFAVCWICWVEVRGSQCHVSENISRLHSLSLLVCLEISSVAWLSSRGSMRGGGEGPGRSYSKLHFLWNNMHDSILIMKQASTAGQYHRHWREHKRRKQVFTAPPNSLTQRKTVSSNSAVQRCLHWFSFLRYGNCQLLFASY